MINNIIIFKNKLIMIFKGAAIQIKVSFKYKNNQKIILLLMYNNKVYMIKINILNVYITLLINNKTVK